MKGLFLIISLLALLLLVLGCRHGQPRYTRTSYIRISERHFKELDIVVELPRRTRIQWISGGGMGNFRMLAPHVGMALHPVQMPFPSEGRYGMMIHIAVVQKEEYANVVGGAMDIFIGAYFYNRDFQGALDQIVVSQDPKLERVGAEVYRMDVDLGDGRVAIAVGYILNLLPYDQFYEEDEQMMRRILESIRSSRVSVR